MSNEHHGLATSSSFEEGGVPQERTAPLGANDFGSSGETDFNDLTSGTTGASKKLNGGLVLLAAVVLIAGAGLFSMKKLAEATAAAAIDSEIESTVEQFLDKIKSGEARSALYPDGDQVVLAVLSETYSEKQVPLRDVQRDPFQIGTPEAVDPMVIPDTGSDQRAMREWERKRAERLDMLHRASEDLRLTAILGGSQPLAIINGEMTRAGETVAAGEFSFRVSKINKNSADLTFAEPDWKISETITIQIQR